MGISWLLGVDGAVLVLIEEVEGLRDRKLHKGIAKVDKVIRVDSFFSGGRGGVETKLEINLFKLCTIPWER